MNTKRCFIHFSRTLIALAMAVMAASAFAVAQTPDQLVTQTTERVLSVAREAKSYYDKDPQRLNRQVDDIMSEVTDFDGFARGVMGTYASEQRYRALKTDAERAAFRARIEKFTAVFRGGLIETYAKGLLKFNGERIETVAGRSTVNGVNATVVQHIHGDANQPYVIQYTLRKDRSGVWKLRNVIIEGVNLGLTYRNQFASSAQQYGGDLDKVIANWRVEADVKPASDAAKGAQ
jgi:phospholipid transport system substrate-binding protein